MKINALVLAGGKLKNSTENEYKAFLPIGNLVMLDIVINALRESRHVENITVTSIPKNHSVNQKDVKTTDTKENIISSIENAIKEMPEDKTLLVASDIPLINGSIIDDFVNKCSQVNAAFCYPIIPKESVENKFPGAERTYFKLKEGAFTGGNIIMISNKEFLKNLELAKKIYKKRKKPISIIKIIGFKSLYKFMRKNLTIADVEEKASKIINVSAKAIITPHPEVGTDVDNEEDYFFVKKVLKT